MTSVVEQFAARSVLLLAITLVFQVRPSGEAGERVEAPAPLEIQQSLRFVPDRMVHYHVPALSLAVIHNHNIECAQAFGNARPGGAAVTPETLFQASSISMPLTAVAVLRLVEQGKLALDVDVNQYLRSWKVPKNRFTEQKKVTLRELLSHTAGATVHGYEGYTAGQKMPTLVQVLNGESPANSAPVTIDFVPGTKFRYASGNYVIIQQLLVDVMEKPFPALMQELVLQPVHMAHSTFQQPLPQELMPLAAMPYYKDGKAIEEGPHAYPEMAVAGLWTTASDLARFALAVQDALAGKPSAIVSSQTAHEMLQPVQGFYALGFSMAGDGAHRYFSHPGANLGYLSFFFAYEKGDGVVLMTNSQYSKPLCLQVIRALASQYGWNEFPTESTLDNPWIIILLCATLLLTTFVAFRLVRCKTLLIYKPPAIKPKLG